MLSVVIGEMALVSAIFSGSFLILTFNSKIFKKIFLMFAIAFGFSRWALFEYAIFLAGSDLFYLIFYPEILIPILPFTFTSVALFIFLFYLLVKKKWA